MPRKSLPKAPAEEKLGLPTIMDRALAARHGVAYVHLAAFAIDVDRVREAVEGYTDPRPFGWEVFLTEAYVLDRFAEPSEAQQALLDDAVTSILEGEPDVLGGQLVFAIWDAISRGLLPGSLRTAFDSWLARPVELVRELEALWREEPSLRRELARGCLDVDLEPPLAPPTREALARMAGEPRP